MPLFDNYTLQDAQQELLAYSPYSYLTFSEVSGLVASDVVRLSNPASYTSSGVRYQQSGIVRNSNNGVFLDGANGYVTLNQYSFPSTTFVNSAWVMTVYIPVLSGGRTVLLDISDSNDNHLMLEKPTGLRNILKLTVGNNVFSGSDIPLLTNGWHLIIINLDGVNASVFVDGVKYISAPYNALNYTPINGFIGASIVNGSTVCLSRFFISDLLSFSHALSQSDVNAMSFIDVPRDKDAGATNTGDKNDEFVQLTPLSVWNVNHGLGKRVSITVTGLDNLVVDCRSEFIDNNNVKLTFSEPFAGIASFN